MITSDQEVSSFDMIDSTCEELLFQLFAFFSKSPLATQNPSIRFKLNPNISRSITSLIPNSLFLVPVRGRILIPASKPGFYALIGIRRPTKSLGTEFGHARSRAHLINGGCPTYQLLKSLNYSFLSTTPSFLFPSYYLLVVSRRCRRSRTSLPSREISPGASARR